MDWSKGFSAQYDLVKVDPVSFLDMGPLRFTAGTIDNSNSGLMQSADLTMTEDPGECWVRVYLKARQSDSGARVALFTGLTSAPERSLDGYRNTFNVECYSVLKPIDDVLVPRGFYAPAGADAAALVADLFSVGPAPVVADDDSPALLEPIVAEADMSRLDVAWLILNAVGWQLRIDGNGTIRICPYPAEPSITFDARKNDALELSLTDEQDWFSVPNCIRVVSGTSYVEYKDDDPDSAVSTVSRKAARGGTGEIWLNDTAASIGSNESLAEYAMRILKDNQSPARKVTYSRRYFPDVFVSDLVDLRFPGAGIDGTFRITSQRIELGYGCRTSEEVTGV